MDTWPGLSSVTGGEVVLPVIPLLVRPLLVAVDANLAPHTAALHPGSWSLQGKKLCFSLPELQIVPISTGPEKLSLLNFLQHTQGRGVRSNGYLWKGAGVQWANKFTGL